MELELGQAIVALSLAFAAVITFVIEKLRRDQKVSRKANTSEHNKVILGLKDVYDQVQNTRDDVSDVNKSLNTLNNRLSNHLDNHEN